jgi:lipopolysaccharide/colanic/teichoic acid biosynthesis glycosyltransferase
MLNANSRLQHETLAFGGTRERHLSSVFQHQSLIERMKRVGDVVIACAILAITLPLMVIVALAIKCESSGPVLERQPCIRSGGRRFRMLKFRTSVHDPEQSTPVWAQRMTRVGRLLRYTRIEVLPQLVNVLRGEMGIIDGDEGSPSFLE